MPNLAAHVSDGKEVKVPIRAASTRSGTARVDLNSAGVAELETVPGVDAELAHAIVDFRTRYGAFTSLSDLHTLLGLDTGLVALLRPYLTVSR